MLIRELAHRAARTTTISILLVCLLSQCIFSIDLTGEVDESKIIAREAEVVDLLNRLLSTDPDVLKQAKKELFRFKFRKQDLKHLYAAIEKEYPDDMEEYESTKAYLFRGLWSAYDDSTVDFINRIYPELPPNPNIVSYALRTLTVINTPESLSSLSEILLNYKPDFGFSIYILFVPVMSRGNNLDSILPAVLELIKQDYYKDELYFFIANWLDNGSLGTKAIMNMEDQVFADFAESLELSQETTDVDEKVLWVAEMTADILGYSVDKEKSIPLLEKGLQHAAPRIQLYCLISLIRMGEHVSDESINMIAGYPLLRSILYDILYEMEKTELFPEAYMTQEHFAESDMVSWLTSPMEFGRPPDKLELLATKEIIDDTGEDGDEAGRVYLYKYFYEDDEDGWMVGMSGPQPLDKNEFITTGYLTFSNWFSLDEMSIEEHFDSLLYE